VPSAPAEGQFATAGATRDGLHVRTHQPRGGDLPDRAACDCREPWPRLLVRAALALGLDLRVR
jgi:hypothetical protein